MCLRYNAVASRCLGPAAEKNTFIEREGVEKGLCEQVLCWTPRTK
jgi:hypothetical protein